MDARRGCRGGLERWGFATAVACALGAAAWAGIEVSLPDRIPGFALKADAVYRVEVAAAVFAGLYVALLSFVLALHNRGFTEIGTAGLSARDLKGFDAEASAMRVEIARDRFRQNVVDKKARTR